MDLRVTVHFARRCLQKTSAGALREQQRMVRALDAGQRRVHRVALVVNRASSTREVEDHVDVQVIRFRYVVAHELKSRVGEQVFQILERACREIVESYDSVTFLEKPP